MNIKTPLILLVVLIILGGVITWDRWQSDKEAQQKEQANKLTEIVIDDITKISYRDRGNDKDQATEFVLEKNDGRWRVTAPLASLADTSEVEDFVKTVLDYKYEQVIADNKSEAAKFGLAEAQRTIELFSGPEKSFTLYLGNKSVVGYSAYLATSVDQRILLGSQYILTSTAKRLFDFRDKKLIVIDSTKVNRLTFWHRDTKTFEVVRHEGRFQLSSQEKTSQLKVEEYLEAFNDVRVEKFIDDPSPELRNKFTVTDKLLMSAVFENEADVRQQLVFARDRDQLLATFDASKIIYVLPKSFEEKVRELTDNFRDHRIFSFNTDDVQQIDIDGDSYRRVDNQWYPSAQIDDGGKLLDNAQMNDTVDLLLVSLETAETIKFIDRTTVSELITKAAARQIILSLNSAADGTDTTLTIKFWSDADNDERYYLSHSDDQQMFSVAKSLLEGYRAEPDSDNLNN